MTQPVAERRACSPVDRASQGLGIRVNQQLGGIEAVAACGIVRAVNAIAVKLSGGTSGNIDVPGIACALPDRNHAGRLPRSRSWEPPPSHSHHVSRSRSAGRSHLKRLPLQDRGLTGYRDPAKKVGTAPAQFGGDDICVLAHSQGRRLRTVTGPKRLVAVGDVPLLSLCRGLGMPLDARSRITAESRRVNIILPSSIHAVIVNVARAWNSPTASRFAREAARCSRVPFAGLRAGGSRGILQNECYGGSWAI
jgi:hypothetical protein